jgi:hypothetical protein
MRVSALLSGLQLLGAIAGIWTLVSIGTALLLVPWFRAQARANVVQSLRNLREDWLIAAHEPAQLQPATR